MNLLAFCRNGDEYEIKRVPLTNAVQQSLLSVLLQQETAFRDERPEEVEFSGDWKPDDNELLVLSATPEAEAMLDAAEGNALALDEIDSPNFSQENIKALFVAVEEGGQTKILVQRFTAGQLLDRKFSLLLGNNSFKQLTDPAFSIATKLTCIIENGQIKFDSYSNVRSIFDLMEFYQEATDEDIDDFGAHVSLEIEDMDVFKGQATQTTRKLIHKIVSSGVLDAHSAAEIQQKAEETDLELTLDDGKIVIPNDKKEALNFLHFLNDGLYEAALSGRRYVTNSKREA